MKKILFCLALISTPLFFSGCPEVTPLRDADTLLVGKWNNGGSGNDLKTFQVFKDFTFTCRINPGPKDANENPNYQGWGTVEGQLTPIYDVYIMHDLRGKGDEAGTTWHTQLPGFEGQRLLMRFIDNYTFTFESANHEEPLVDQFFGGTYSRDYE